MKKLFILINIFSVLITQAQLDKYWITPPYYIKTVKLDDGKIEKPSSIIALGRQIFFSFDDLQADEKEYSYKISRFDENWQPSSLNESEYIKGFSSDIITNVEQSYGTLQSYTHYQLTLPNENTHILLSGNYMIQILDENEKIIFSKPFILYEKKIPIGIQIKWANNVNIKNHLQMIDFILYKGNYNIINETKSLTIKIFQNNDISYSIDFHQPTFYKANQWIYHYPQEALFEGINEFRRFETTDIRGYNYGIAKKELNDKLYDFYTYPGEFRTHYLFYKDINGAYILNSEQASDNVHTEADYVNVHFYFKGNLDKNQKLYIYGSFNDFYPTEDYKLEYNKETQSYEVSILLKQGYYDYMFITKNPKEEINITSIEGSFAQTENDYTIIAYYHPPGARYTKIIGFGKASSDNIK